MEKETMLNFLNIRNHFHQYHEDKSQWAYGYCKTIKDKKEVYKYITDSGYAYTYCNNIKDRKAVREYITGSKHSYKYCKYIKDRPEIRKYLENRQAYIYCKHVKDNKQVSDNIENSFYALQYCMFVKDRKSVRDNITRGKDLSRYLQDVREDYDVRYRLRDCHNMLDDKERYEKMNKQIQLENSVIQPLPNIDTIW